MNKYNVELTYPRSTRQQPYEAEVEAVSQTQAIAAVKIDAARDGWIGEPVKVKLEVIDK